MTTAALTRAQADVERGDLGGARRRVASFISSTTYSPEALAMVADISHKMHDPVQAGRYWLLTPVTRPEVERAIEAFAWACHHDSRLMASERPRFPGRYKLADYPEVVRERLTRYGINAVFKQQDGGVDAGPEGRVEAEGDGARVRASPGRRRAGLLRNRHHRGEEVVLMPVTVGGPTAKVMRATITLDAEGGRRWPIWPRGGTYRPHLIVEGSTSMLGVQFVDGPETIAPGDTGNIELQCIYGISYDELRPGVRFTIVEGPHRVGVGTVQDCQRRPERDPETPRW